MWSGGTEQMPELSSFGDGSHTHQPFLAKRLQFSARVMISQRSMVRSAGDTPHDATVCGRPPPGGETRS